MNDMFLEKEENSVIKIEQLEAGARTAATWQECKSASRALIDFHGEVTHLGRSWGLQTSQLAQHRSLAPRSLHGVHSLLACLFPAHRASAWALVPSTRRESQPAVCCWCAA